MITITEQPPAIYVAGNSNKYVVTSDNDTFEQYKIDTEIYSLFIVDNDISSWPGRVVVLTNVPENPLPLAKIGNVVKITGTNANYDGLWELTGDTLEGVGGWLDIGTTISTGFNVFPTGEIEIYNLNFAIKCEVLYGGSVIATIYSKQLISELRQEYSFQVESILKNYLSYKLYSAGGFYGDTANEPNVIEYQLRFTEVWRNASGVLTEYDTITTAVKTLWNGRILSSENIDDYIFENTETNKLLQVVLPTEYYKGSFLFLNSYNKIASNIAFSFFDSSNVLISSYVPTTVTGFATLVLDDTIVPSNAVKIISAYLQDGLPIIWNINVKKPCLNNSVYLFWVNRLGGFESHLFQEQITKKKKNKKIEYRDQNDKLKLLKNTEIEKELEIESDLLSKANAEQLAEVINAEYVFILEGTEFKDVYVESNEIEYDVKTELSNIKLKIIVSND